MRLLMMYARRFAYDPAVTNLENPDAQAESAALENVLVGFVHVEAEDAEKAAQVETKLVKNLKWAARKNETEQVIVHSFAHLSASKADPGFTRELLDRAAERLRGAGYQVHQTPFGYFLDLDLRAPGHSFARLFKEF
jgi:uncharacterized protein YpuA (DUF1002 family)